MRNLLLYPLSLLYGFIIAFRNQLYDLKFIKSTEFDIPVISIGNITVGGTGKTPHTEYLIRLLGSQFRVATLSRGYKRKTEGFRKVETTSAVTEVGDEPLQMKRKFPEINVFICENRVTGINEILSSGPKPDVILLDDAFQHRRVTPGVNIVLVDYNKPLKKDRMLPAGNLRESPWQIRRASVIIITKCPSEITPITRRIIAKDVHLFPYQELYFTTLQYGALYPVFSEALQSDQFADTGKMGVLAVSGIASPEDMHRYLRNSFAEVETAIFPDHHYYLRSDILLIIQKFVKLKSAEKIIVTTEKDAARLISLDGLPGEFKSALFCLPVQVRFPDKEGKSFDKKILSYVGENKSNREIHFRKNPNQS
jgi:tetraacyldisaccharide 4'-kinase